MKNLLNIYKKIIFVILVFSIVGVSYKHMSNTSRDFKYVKAGAYPFSSLLKNTQSFNKRTPSSITKNLGLSVTINEGEVAYLDESTSIDTLTINGSLYCDEKSAPDVLKLRVKTIIVNGLFQCGTSADPYDKKLIISLKHNPSIDLTSHHYRGIIVGNGGELNFSGSRQNAGWSKLAKTMEVGDTTILVHPRFSRVISTLRNRFRFPFKRRLKWKIGDEIVVGPTGFNYEEAEKFKIVAIDKKNPNLLHLDKSAEFRHWGKRKRYHSRVLGRMNFDERAEVANLSRSIRIQADEEDFPIEETNSYDSERGGHVMVHHMSKAYIDGVEFYKMGQAGVMGRYPFHWHYAGNAQGQFIKNSSIHHSFQRCIVVHRTQNTLLHNNVCYDFKGHGYFLEDGNETGNRIIRNLAIKAKPPFSSKLLLASDDISNSESQGRFPSVSGFWISNPDNYITGNVVSGSIGSGFWMSFEKEVLDNSGNVVARPLTTATNAFNYNSAHATQVGITWDGAADGGLTNNPNNPNDRRLVSAHYNPPNTPVFRGLKAYKNYLTGIYWRGQTAIFDKSVVAENGRSFWLAYNQIVRNSFFIGKTDNSSESIDQDYYNKVRSDRYRKAAMTLYDGPFEIHNSDFFDFSTEASTFKLNSGATINNTVIPFVGTGGTNKFTNFVSKLRFSPEPIYRAHLENPNIYKERSFLGISRIRDLDGSLTGTRRNSVITGKRSLGVLANSGCSDGGESLYNYKVCPSSFTESSFDYMRWGGSGHSPWSTPFIMLRSDGVASYPINEWNYVRYISNSTVSLANTEHEIYELLPRYQYEYDSSVLGASARVEANSESTNPKIPIVKVVAYGNNCRLGSGAVEVSSLYALRRQDVTSYYSKGEHFFVKVVPNEKWRMFSSDPRIGSTANATNKRFPITCDSGYLSKRVVGKLEKVERGPDSTTLEGWACNYTHSSSIQVQVYAIKKSKPLRRKWFKRSRRAPIMSSPILLAQSYSNQTPNETISVRCGYMSGAGRKFKIKIPNRDLPKDRGYKFYIKGLSNSGGDNLYIKGSGVYSAAGKS